VRLTSFIRPVVTASRKRKTPNGSETSSKKTKKLPDFLEGSIGLGSEDYGIDLFDDDDDDIDSIAEELLKQHGFVHGEQVDLTGDDEDMEPKWVYTGAKTIKSIRQACEEVH
jgi:hypothetical protein